MEEEKLYQHMYGLLFRGIVNGLDLLEQMCTQTQREDSLFRGRLEDAALEISWQEDQGLITYTISCLDENQSPVYSLELVCLEGGGV